MILTSFRRAPGRQAPNPVGHARFYALTRRFKPSPEQQEVVKLLQTHNVVVSARPGAGKTATAEALAQGYPDVPIAVITYSKRLQMDTEKHLENYPNVDTYTFHGLAGRLFGRIIKDDIDLTTERVSQSIPLIDDSQKYRFVVLDELQDLTDNLYWLASTFIGSITRFSGRSPRILALGDSRQAIYDYRGADFRFLEQAETILRPVSDCDWKSLSLSQSFRLTRCTADFINNACLGGEQYILGTGNGPKPVYLRANLWKTKDLFDFLWPYIEKYEPGKCAILAPSIRRKVPPTCRSSPPIRKMPRRHYLTELANTLSRKGVPVSVSIYDDAPLDEDVTRGKLVVSTYHQFKGSERDLVIVIGADDSWFRWFGPDVPHDCCPNPVFVALTRARKQLIIIQSAHASPMPFIDVPALESHTKFFPLHKPQPASEKAPDNNTQVTNLTRHLQDEDLLSLIDLYTRIKMSPLPDPEKRLLISPPKKVRTDPSKDFWEPVADLSGVAITAAFEWKFTSRLTVFGSVGDIPKNNAFWFAEQAVRYEAEGSGYKSRWIQMRKQQRGRFGWLVKHLDHGVDRLAGEVTQERKIEMKDLRFECELVSSITIPVTSGDKRVILVGRADIVFDPKDGTRATIWEIKLVKSLKHNHVAQLVQYGLLWANSHPNAPFPRLLLFNLRDGERWEISTTKEEALEFVVGLFRAKRMTTKLTDEEFRRQCEKTSDEAQAIIDRLPPPAKA